MNKKIYLDYAATTPVDPRVLEAMLPYFGNSPARHALQGNAGWGNPGSLHSFGQRASGAVFEGRQIIARALGAHYTEIVFTGSATEANNLVLRGAVKASGIKTPRIIISAIEHESILDTAEDLKRSGIEVIVIPVSKDGLVDLKKIKAAINDRTVLVSVMYVNNEVGTVQPIFEISKIVAEFRKNKIENRSKDKKNSNFYSLDSTFYPLLHTDAVQAFQYLNCNVNDLGVDLMTLSAHKIYGPKGIGALYVRKVKGDKRQGKPMSHVAFPISPIITGGGQEQGLRSGTENVPYIVGFAKAVALTQEGQLKEVKRISILRDYAFKQIKKNFKNVQMNGPSFAKASDGQVVKNRIPNNLNFYIPKISGEKVLVGLDLAGIAVSSGPACSARTLEPSHVLLACGFNKDRAKNSIRLSLGRQTTKSEIDYFVSNLKKLAH